MKFNYLYSVSILLICLSGLVSGDVCTDSIAEKPIIVVIPSYNNSKWYEQNMYSVLHQNYSNYHIIYIDDCSSDDTYQLIKEYVEQQGCQNKVTLLRNPDRCGAMANIYVAVHACKDDYIMVLVDGDDWLIHGNVLSCVNRAYAQNDVWMTYGQFLFYPENRMGECKQIPEEIIQQNLFREYDWCSSHLRTFYAGLFKQIKMQDLMYNGKFFDVTWDRAFMYPMLEMAGQHSAFIPEILYAYNCDNPSNDFKTKLLEQINCCNLIRSMKKYEHLTVAPYKNQRE